MQNISSKHNGFGYEMQEEGTGPGSLIENSSLLAQGGESDFLHLPGLGCTLKISTPKTSPGYLKGEKSGVGVC